MRPVLDITGALDGFALRLDGEVLATGTLSHVARARMAAHIALDDLERIFRIEGLQNQRRAA